MSDLISFSYCNTSLKKFWFFNLLIGIIRKIIIDRIGKFIVIAIRFIVIIIKWVIIVRKLIIAIIAIIINSKSKYLINWLNLAKNNTLKLKTN